MDVDSDEDESSAVYVCVGELQVVIVVEPLPLSILHVHAKETLQELGAMLISDMLNVKTIVLIASTHRTWVGILLLLVTDFFHGNISGEAPNFDLEDVRPLLNRGQKGLNEFCKFFDYFLQIGFPVKCLQDPVLLLERAIDIEHVAIFL
ncbi:hypothetical protein B0H11DRAFT_2227336 [Mycena galericulata]|nr:hypothetical protein B0H11DRAFT_2227336 [Mycena galericulata]